MITGYTDYAVHEEYFPNWETYTPLLSIPGPDVSTKSCTYHGVQTILDPHPLFARYCEEVMEFWNDKLQDKKLLVPITGWYIKYKVAGWQALHCHGSSGFPVVSTILCLSSPPDPSFVARIKKGNRFVEQHFYDTPGKIRLFNSHDVYHGALPTTSERNIVVADFKFKYL